MTWSPAQSTLGNSGANGERLCNLLRPVEDHANDHRALSFPNRGRPPFPPLALTHPHHWLMLTLGQDPGEVSRHGALGGQGSQVKPDSEEGPFFHAPQHRDLVTHSE